MIFVPSARALIHDRCETLSMQFLDREVPGVGCGDEDLIAIAQCRVYTDLRILGDINRPSRLPMQQYSISGFFSRSNRVTSYLLHGLKAKSLHDPVSAVSLLYEVAKQGDVNAMLELGYLLKDMGSTSKATLWFTRAMRMGNIDALLALGNVHAETRDYQSALFFYAAHFKFTHSLQTGFRISETFLRVGKYRASMKWLRYCAAHGHHAAVQEIIAIIGKDVDMHNVIYQWLKVATRLKTVKQQPFFFSPLLKAKLTPDKSLPPLSAGAWRLNDPFIGQDVAANLLPSLAPAKSFEPKVVHGLHRLANDFEQILPFAHPFNSNGTLLMILELASDDSARRNLRLCESHLRRARRKIQTFPCDLHIWRAKCASEDPRELIKCAFVSCLMDDYKFGLSLFQKAARSGNTLAVVMCGIILYYGLHGEREIERAVFCFSRCQLDPIALMHIAIISGSKEWKRRAKELMAPCGECKNAYELMGDLFWSGTKFPRNVEIALMWYFQQYTKEKKRGNSTDSILEKIRTAQFEQMSLA